MPTLTVHHIGYLVKKMEKAIESFKSLGYRTLQDIVYDDVRKVHICFMEKDGYRIELISPAAEDSVVSGLMKKYKNSPYHICYETSRFEQDYQTLLSGGFTAIDTPAPAVALQGKDVVFLTSPVMGMIELLAE